MTKELEFIRKAVIMACHPECKSYEEALRKELNVGCIIEYDHRDFFKLYGHSHICPKSNELITTKIIEGADYNGSYRALNGMSSWSELFNFGKHDVPIKNIIGQPITLSKVLLALGKIDSIYVEIDDYGHIWQTTAANVHSRKKVTEWDLTKDLDNQDSKSILAISILLGYDK